MRTKTIPAFSPAKIKGMFPIINDRAEKLQKFVLASDTVEVFNLMTRYTTDFIASAAFGYEVDSINDPTHEFRDIASKVFEPSLMTKIRQMGMVMFPELMVLFNIHFQPQVVSDFFLRIVRMNVEYREQNNFSRKDFLQTLIQIRNMGEVTAESWESKTSESK